MGREAVSATLAWGPQQRSRALGSRSVTPTKLPTEAQARGTCCRITLSRGLGWARRRRPHGGTGSFRSCVLALRRREPRLMARRNAVRGAVPGTRPARAGVRALRTAGHAGSGPSARRDAEMKRTEDVTVPASGRHLLQRHLQEDSSALSL